MCVLSGCNSLPAGGDGGAIAGSGSPVIVLEAGAGDGRETWKPILSAVSAISTSYTYSRRGYGHTGPAPWKRDGTEVVEDLRRALAKRELHPPYVLVGHSLGGLYMELFAKLHPEEVAGLVLIDATHPDHLERMRSERPGGYRMMQVLLAVNPATPLAADLRGTADTSREWHEAGPPPVCPTIFLTATRSRLVDGKDFAEFSSGLQKELVAQWPGAEQRFVDSTHYIHREKPEIVVAAIREVVEKTRGR